MEGKGKEGWGGPGRPKRRYGVGDAPSEYNAWCSSESFFWSHSSHFLVVPPNSQYCEKERVSVIALLRYLLRRAAYLLLEGDCRLCLVNRCITNETFHGRLTTAVGHRLGGKKRCFGHGLMCVCV